MPNSLTVPWGSDHEIYGPPHTQHTHPPTSVYSPSTDRDRDRLTAADREIERLRAADREIERLRAADRETMD